MRNGTQSLSMNLSRRIKLNCILINFRIEFSPFSCGDDNIDTPTNEYLQLLASLNSVLKSSGLNSIFSLQIRRQEFFHNGLTLYDNSSLYLGHPSQQKNKNNV